MIALVVLDLCLSLLVIHFQIQCQIVNLSIKLAKLVSEGLILIVQCLDNLTIGNLKKLVIPFRIGGLCFKRVFLLFVGWGHC